MDEDSKRREQIRARQAKDRARAGAIEAEQKNALDRTDEVRGLWTRAHETLIEVIGAWNRAFAEEGEPYRSFRLEPFRQPGKGELFLFDLYHLNSRRPNTVSVTHILVDADGTVRISHPDVNRSIAVERIAKEDWDDVLSAIHWVDTSN
jgi:hypothetical protein